jgi:hypothetical protein
VVLNGPGGWANILPQSAGKATTEKLLPGELARLVSGLSSERMTPEHARRALEAFVRVYAAGSLSPLAPAMTASGIADMSGH